MHSRKGITQVDWVISMALFIGILAFIIMSLKPSFVRDTPADLLTPLIDNFERNVTGQIDKYPLFISTSQSSNNIIRINYTLPFNSSEFTILNHSFLLDDYLWIVANTTLGTNIFYLLKSDAPIPIYDGSLFVSNSSAHTLDFSVNFDGGLLKNINFVKPLVKDFELRVDGEVPQWASIINTSSSSSIAKFSAVDNQLVSHTTYMFSKNYFLYNRLSTSDNRTVSLKFTLNKFSDYYIDSLHSGIVPANCLSFNSNKLRLSEVNLSLNFVFDDVASAELCSHNTTLTLEYLLNVDGELDYTISASKNDSAQFWNSFPDAYLGQDEPIRGISYDRLMKLSALSYSSLKDVWGVSDFHITISNSTGIIFTYGSSPPKDVDVRAVDKGAVLLSSEGDLSLINMNFQVWR